MAISTYLELTNYLVERFLKRFYNEDISLMKNQINGSETSIQWQLENGSQKVLTVILTGVSDSVVLVNLLKADGSVEAGSIDWKDEDLNQGAAKFPIETDSVPQEVVDNFNEKFSLQINRKELAKLFGQPLVETRVSRGEDNARAPVQDIPLPTVEFPSSRARPNDMPDFDDEYEMRHSNSANHPSSVFPSIGDRDLNPPGLSSEPPMKPYLDPLAPDNDGGMYPSSNHPLFGTRRSGNTSRLGVPPGARYDDPLADDDLDALGAGLPSNSRSNNGFPGPSFGNSGNGPFSNFGGPSNPFGF